MKEKTKGTYNRLELLIKEKEDSFTSQDQKIADYMLANQDKLISMSISELADSSSVSQSAAVRFCKKLGFEGTKQFRVFLNSVMLMEESKASSCTLHDSDGEIFQKTLDIALASLRRSFESTSSDNLASIADLIKKSSNILVFGIGGSAIAASYMCSELRRLGKMVFGYSDIYTIRTFRAHFSPSDLLFFVSRSGENEDLIRLAEYAKKNGAVIAVISSDPSSTLCKTADAVIISPEMQFIDGDRNSFSRLGQLALISSLYTMCASRFAAENPDFDRNYLNLTNYR